ncbi:MAG: sulfatase-like hydrolase/transferase [Campylobacter sp.]|nr:sulfatase-like hydrolase/transferase [Campylobacter sp.]
MGNFFTISLVNFIKISLVGAPLLTFWRYILLAVLFVTAIILFCIVYYLRISKSTKTFKFASFYCAVALILSVAFNPFTKTCIDFLKITYIESYPVVMKKLKDNYKKPIISKPTMDKNVVYIYLESFSRNFLTNYPGLTPNINSIDNRIDFTKFYQIYDGATITLEGLFASQCGLPFPLALFYGDKKEDGGKNLMNAKPKFPGQNIICATDILKSLDYHTYFIKGASLKFQLTDEFLKSRSYDEVYGKDELLKRGAKSLNEWGVDDDEMLGFAYEDFIRMSQSGEKFLQVVLNVAMHVPDGFVSKSCEKTESSNMLNAVKCTDKLIGEFIDKIRSSKYSQNTIIVLQSDHLMPFSLANGIDKEKLMDSRLLFMILDDDIDGIKIVENQGSSLDTFNTFLGYMGITDEMNLGRNIIKKDSTSKVYGIGLVYQATMRLLEKLKYDDE